MSSATEAELGALYIMAREAVYIRIILEEMGHKQPPTPLQTDNSMADGVGNGQNTTETNESNGHAIPLAARPRMSRTIQNILATRQIKLCRLLDEASSRKASQKHSQRISYSHDYVRNA